MDWIDIVKIVSGPLIGAVIGLFTNWIAVRMLFVPRKALYIGKWHVPFTPGVIPRRQEALARALGNTISESLVRKEDLKRTLCSNGVSRTVAQSVLSLPSVQSIGTRVLGSEKYGRSREKALDLVTDQILDGILAVDIGAVISREASAAVSGYAAANPLVRMFVSDQMIGQLTAPVADKVTAYLQTEGREKLRETLAEKLDTIEDKPVRELVKNPEKFETVIISFYRSVVNEYADAVVDHFHIERIVEEKIRAMEPRDLENLVLTVMKKELNALIWLGIPIGFIMGCVTTLINHI